MEHDRQAITPEELLGGEAEQIGKYILLRELGRGSSGIVYLAFDPFAEREVALKVYFRDEQLDKSQLAIQRKLFFTEAHMAGRLQHPNILPIHDAGEEAGLRYVVMAYLADARPLSDYVKPDRLLPIPDVVRLFFAVARGLEYAHGKGVVHCDIKPANIMMSPDTGHSWIVDFGIARSAMLESTQIMGLVGTPRYTSPEQIEDQAPTHRSDLFSLGSVIYELLAGRPAADSDSFPSLIHQVLNVRPEPVREWRPEVPAPLDEIVMRLIEKRPEDRPRSAGETADALAEVFEYLDEHRARIDEEERFKLARGLDFFRDFGDAEIWELVRAADWVEFNGGQRIITEGDQEENFYVLVEGVVTVQKDRAVLGQLVAGDCFGEMGYLRRAPRNATIRALERVVLLKLSKNHMERASKDTQLKFYEVFLRTLIHRLQRTNEMLATLEL